MFFLSRNKANLDIATWRHRVQSTASSAELLYQVASDALVYTSEQTKIDTVRKDCGADLKTVDVDGETTAAFHIMHARRVFPTFPLRRWRWLSTVFPLHTRHEWL